jgi:GT2 family glycosyltransferase
MPKVALVQVVYNSMRFIPTVFPAALSQTERDFEFYALIAANEDGGKEYIEEHFPRVKIVDPGYNIGFARGHNEIFSKVDAAYYQLVNPDLVLSPRYVENLLRIFEESPQVGGGCGKLLNYDFSNLKPTEIIDSTGVVMHKSGRGYDRGQHQQDIGQYSEPSRLLAISGAAAMYRRQALQDIRQSTVDGRDEFFDEDFHSYWEDVDLSWRMVNAGWENQYCPSALAYHGRSVPSSPGGYKKVASFIQHRRSIDPAIRRLNYRNHVFLFIKNSPKWYWQFFVREFFYNIFILLFETSTLKEFPRLIRMLPAVLRKRKVQKSQRKIGVGEMESLIHD